MDSKLEQLFRDAETAEQAVVGASASPGSEARVEVRVNGKLLIGLTVTKAPDDAYELIALLNEIVSAPNVPNPDLE